MNSQAANEIAQFIGFSVVVFWVGAIAAFVSSICSLVMTCEIMRTGRGADRLAWLLAVWIPILGPLLFLWLWQKELENRWLEQHSGK